MRTRRERSDLDKSFDMLSTFAGPDDQLKALIDWKAGSIAALKHYRLDTITRGAHMQRQFTIELRVDFADPGKLEPLKQVLQQAARHAYATAQLISDNPKSTQIAIYSEDWFSGHETISLLEDTIQQGLEATSATESAPVSNELMAAVNGS